MLHFSHSTNFNKFPRNPKDREIFGVPRSLGSSRERTAWVSIAAIGEWHMGDNLVEDGNSYKITSTNH